MLGNVTGVIFVYQSGSFFTALEPGAEVSEADAKVSDTEAGVSDVDEFSSIDMVCWAHPCFSEVMF